MADNSNEKSTKDTKKIFYRQTREWIEVSDEYYRIHIKERDMFRDKMRKRDECDNPLKKKWLCDMDCFTCRFRKSEKWESLDAPINEDKSITLGEALPSHPKSLEDDVVDRLLFIEMLKESNVSDEDAQKICLYVINGCSVRRIAKMAGIPLATFQRHWAKVNNKYLKKN